MCGSLGLTELLVILAIVMLLFGASKLPQLGKALGETVRNFKKGTAGKEELDGSQQGGEIQGREVARIEEAEVEGQGQDKHQKKV